MLAGLTVAAGLGNLAHLHLPYGLDLIFGSIFAMLAIECLGTGAGVLVAAVSGAYTLVLWHHPYAWLIVVAEAASVGWLRRHLRPRGEVLPLAALDALYWLCLGMPLVWLCYGGALAMTHTEVLLVALKQAINGVLNASLAGALAIGIRRLRRQPVPVSFSEFLFTTLVLAALAPALGVTVWQNYRLTETMELEVAETLTLVTRLTAADFAARPPSPTLAAARADLPAITERIAALLPQAGAIDLAIDATPPPAGRNVPPPPGALAVELAERPGYSHMVRWRKGHYRMQTALTLGGEPVQLVAELAATQAVESLQRVQLGGFWQLGAITLLALAAAFYISRRIGRPIAALAQTAGQLPSRLEQANPPPPPRPSRLREPAELAAAFARMESALRQNFKDLEQSEARFRAVFEQAPLGIAILGPDRQARFVNPALERLLGRAGAAIKSRPFDDFAHPADIDTDLGLFRELMAGRRDSYQLTKRFRQPDGTPVWAELSVTLLPDSAGGAPLPLALLQDITERRQAEQARAAAELALQRYSAKLEAFSQLATRYQPAAQDLTKFLHYGCSAIGVELAALGEVRGGRYRLLAAVGDTRLAIDAEVPLAEGLTADVRCHAVPQPESLCHPAFGTGLSFLGRATLTWSDADNQVHQGVLDLADRHRCPACGQPEQQILQLVTQRISANLRELAVQDGLLQARQREVIGHLAGGVAHDFNNVLGAIGNNLAYLERLLPTGTVGAEAHGVLAETEAAIDQAKLVTSGLLSLGRGEEIDVSPCDLGALVAAFAPAVSRLLPPGIELILELQPGVTALTNPALLQAALLNLALNSRDAMGATGRLTLCVGAHTDPVQAPPDLGELVGGERAELCVRDTGAGMTEAVRLHIFEPLFSTKSRGHGTGLGLFMVREFTLRSHGAIQVRSAPGAGTEVRLWLPLTHAPAGAASATPRTLPHRAPAAPTTAPPTQGPGVPRLPQVLLVDDDRRVRDSLCRILEGANLTVITAVDGSDALDRLAAAPSIALVLSDIAMPRLDGLALYSALCCNRPELPVILMTGDAAGAQDAAALDPLARVLTKPLDPRALIELVQAIVDPGVTDDHGR
ncbi:PAS domain S-box protein [uncultured Thiodictyon sp.]|uniref:hybrid sensor histidine kinase/response regulator n=1 Tax=uncultured Thiodictyon sp. TaxID=1846217 RepID=UPI0025D3728E|nr:PAS domain S-box protein [uncultured Thiodictyon sp.]